MNQQSLSGNGAVQLESSSGLPSSYHALPETDRVAHGFGASGTGHEAYAMGHSGLGTSSSHSSTSAAVALGMLAHSMNHEGRGGPDNGYAANETMGNNEQNESNGQQFQ